jgi:hypothetical protein
MNNKWNWGVPEWRDANAYPDPETTSIEQWHWEFLRRRQDYREDWLMHYQANAAHWHEHKHPDGPVNYVCVAFPYFTSEPSPGLQECLDRYNLRSLWDPSIEVHHWQYRPHFHKLSDIPDTIRRMLSDPEHYLENDPEAMPELLRRMDDQGLLLCAFDVHNPVDEQLEGVRERLLWVQKGFKDKPIKKGRAHAAKWPLYLRILDARDADVNFMGIGLELMGLDPDVLPKDEDEADKVLNSAEQAGSWAHKRHSRATKVAFNFPI